MSLSRLSSFLPCLLHIFLSLVYLTVLQQWHFPSNSPNEAPFRQCLIHELSLPAAFFSCRVSFLPCLFPAVSLAHFSLSGLPYSTATMAFPFKITVYLMKPLSFSVSFMTCLPPAAFFFIPCLFPAFPLSCRVSCTFFSLWFTLQYCNNGISLQIHCLPNEAPFRQCLIHDLSSSRCVFFMPCLFPALPLSCRVSCTFFSLWFTLQYCTMAFPFKITVYLMKPLSFNVSFMTCLPPAAFFHAVSPSCLFSFLPCLLHIFLSLVYLTVLQQWHFPSKSLFT